MLTELRNSVDDMAVVALFLSAWLSHRIVMRIKGGRRRRKEKCRCSKHFKSLMCWFSDPCLYLFSTQPTLAMGVGDFSLLSSSAILQQNMYDSDGRWGGMDLEGQDCMLEQCSVFLRHIIACVVAVSLSLEGNLSLNMYDNVRYMSI